MAVEDLMTRGRSGIQPKSISPSDIAGQSSFNPAAAGTQPEPEYQPPPKKSDPLPKPGDAYRACARFLNRLSIDPKLIHFVTRDFVCEGFTYSDLRRVRWLPDNGVSGSPVIELRFVEAVITDVVIAGRNLEDVHHWISEGSMPWVWEQPIGFSTRDDAAVVVTGITFHPVDRETGERVKP